ncbi:hypothetical protein C8J57DRAFT_1372454, partial [Mycena rebaudengoi]
MSSCLRLLFASWVWGHLLSWAGSPSLLATPISAPSIRLACHPFTSLTQTTPMVCRLCPSPVFTSFTPMWSTRPSPI